MILTHRSQLIGTSVTVYIPLRHLLVFICMVVNHHLWSSGSENYHQFQNVCGTEVSLANQVKYILYIGKSIFRCRDLIRDSNNLDFLSCSIMCVCCEKIAN